MARLWLWHMTKSLAFIKDMPNEDENGYGDEDADVDEDGAGS